MAGKSKNIRKRIIKNSRINFNLILNSIDVSPEDLNKPMV